MSEKSKSGATGPNPLASTLAIFAVVGIASIAITQGWIEFDEDPIQLTLTAPEKVILPARGDVPLTYTVNLKNNTEEPVVLEATNPCRIHRWFVADAGGNFVQGEPEETCAQVVMNADLTPSSFVEDTNEIMLDAARYKAGDQYQLMVRFWGYDKVHVFESE